MGRGWLPAEAPTGALGGVAPPAEPSEDGPGGVAQRFGLVGEGGRPLIPREAEHYAQRCDLLSNFSDTHRAGVAAAVEDSTICEAEAPSRQPLKEFSKMLPMNRRKIEIHFRSSAKD